MKEFIYKWLQKDKGGPNPNNSLCYYPFMNLMTTANGKYKPCCKWSEVLTNNGEELQAPKHSMKDAWSSDELKQLRKDLLAGKKPKKCQVCWNEEASGIKSMRYDSVNYGVNSRNLSKVNKPVRLDVYPSNVCNLKCRICSPEYSSKWIQEAKDTQGIDEEVHLNLTEENMNLLDDWLPNIVELGLFGGEPLFQKETFSLMQLCVDKGYSKNITLLINTNGSIYSEKLVNMFNSFKKVLLNFSIDDVEDRFEYQRKGAKWKHSITNIEKFVHAGGYKFEDRIESKMCCTVSSLNIYYLPEYFDWMNKTFPGMSIYLNFLHGPYSLSARNLPGEVKNKIREKLSANEVVFSGTDQTSQNRTLKNILDFLDLPQEHSFSLFFNEIKRGDEYRKESFPIVFSEFWDLISDFESSSTK